MNTDIEWEKWGKQDPYFGVLTHEKFRRQKLSEETKQEFFESGKNEINHILKICKQYIDPNFSPKKILDFGCGTGRMIIPMSEMAEHIVGLDISESMLKEACKNCEKYSIQNIDLRKSDDNLSSLHEQFDLIFSFIVFQHIPPERGKYILNNLLKHLNKGGICAIQFTYAKTLFRETYGMPPRPTLKNKVGQHIRNIIVIVIKSIRKLLRVQSHNQDPEMQMNIYNLNELFFITQSADVEDMHVEFTNHKGECGVFLYFRKPAGMSS